MRILWDYRKTLAKYKSGTAINSSRNKMFRTSGIAVDHNCHIGMDWISQRSDRTDVFHASTRPKANRDSHACSHLQLNTQKIPNFPDYTFKKPNISEEVNG